MIEVIVALQQQEHVARMDRLAPHDVINTIPEGGSDLDLLLRVREGELVVLDEAFTAKHLGCGVAEWCRRNRSSGLPLLVFGEFSSDGRAVILDAGADDVQSCRIGDDELVARMQAIVRWQTPGSRRVFDDGYLRVDEVARSVYREGTMIAVYGAEFELLTVLLRLAPATVSLGTLEACINRKCSSAPRVRPLINHLQRKIGRKRLQTVHGDGYRYV